MGEALGKKAVEMKIERVGSTVVTSATTAASRRSPTRVRAAGVKF